MEIKETGKCCLCGSTYVMYGNNPYPLCDKDDYESRCCNMCNANKVIPARFSRVKEINVGANG